MKKLKHIELFAGCGGMSLGLESAGYELFFANELSPMAGETFAYNLLNETLENNKKPKNTLWIRSQYTKKDMALRLRENPFEATNGKYSDIDSMIDLKGKLLIGDLNQLLTILKESPELVSQIRKENIDLLSGGPPCQSFSLAGKREKDNHKNTLPLSFAQISGLLQPKTVLLENVKGITSPFTEDGEKYYAWLEVAKAFALEGFVPVCMMLNSKYFGVAQNRPRFILIAYRLDIFKSVLKTFKTKQLILQKSFDFFKNVNKNSKTLNLITTKDLDYYDIENSPDLFDGIIFPKITHEDFISSSEAINDLSQTDVPYFFDETSNKYANSLNESFPNKKYKNNLIKNHEPRNHSFTIRSRFRFYQVIGGFQNGLRRGALDLLTGKEVSNDVRKKLLIEFSKHNLLFPQGNDKRDTLMISNSVEKVEMLINSIPTKKHSQRALKGQELAPAQLTIPDDLCHYNSDQPRTLTVREMARFQSFPDWFEFKSKVTTGGKMRRFEVPQYTQVGNAVPPLLAKTLGETINYQLDKII